MAIVEQVGKDLIAAMKAREELKLSVLRMMKTALKLKQVELNKPLEDAEALAVLRTLPVVRHRVMRGPGPCLVLPSALVDRRVPGLGPASPRAASSSASTAAGNLRTGKG